MCGSENAGQDKKYKLGYVPGVFDLFHIGHLNLIRRASAQSEYLLAGVLSDELVEHFKGKKPFIPLEERMEIVAAIREVDRVVEVNFSNTVKMDAWKLYHYDAYFSGDDHSHEWEAERRALQAVGSDIVYLPYTKGTSSTMIKEEIRKAGKRGGCTCSERERWGRGGLRSWRPAKRTGISPDSWTMNRQSI